MNSTPHGTGSLAIDLSGPDARPGYRVLQSLLNVGESALARLHNGSSNTRATGFGRLRGSGPGVSFAALTAELERVLPRKLAYPFEGNPNVGGAVWLGSLLRPSTDASLAKLHWERGINNLPMHVHAYSDRCIIVLDGRGYFHWSEQSFENFDGTRVRTIAARERDLFVFTRGVVHTFSTDQSAMTLLSCQLPFLPFDDPRQYTLPTVQWIARDQLRRTGNVITVDWTYVMLGGGG